MKVEYQLSSHGAGRWSVQVYRQSDGELLQDRQIIREVDGWKVVDVRPDGYGVDGPQHATPEAAAMWYATVVSESVG